MPKYNKHFDYALRKELEQHLRDGRPVAEFANAHGISRQAVYREAARTGGIKMYDAQAAQNTL